MSALEGLATALESVVGSAHLLTNAAVAEYAIDGVLPAMVVLPTDESPDRGGAASRVGISGNGLPAWWR